MLDAGCGGFGDGMLDGRGKWMLGILTANGCECWGGMVDAGISRAERRGRRVRGGRKGRIVAGGFFVENLVRLGVDF